MLLPKSLIILCCFFTLVMFSVVAQAQTRDAMLPEAHGETLNPVTTTTTTTVSTTTTTPPPLEPPNSCPLYKVNIGEWIRRDDLTMSPKEYDDLYSTQDQLGTDWRRAYQGEVLQSRRSGQPLSWEEEYRLAFDYALNWNDDDSKLSCLEDHINAGIDKCLEINRYSSRREHTKCLMYSYFGAQGHNGTDPCVFEGVHDCIDAGSSSAKSINPAFRPSVMRFGKEYCQNPQWKTPTGPWLCPNNPNLSHRSYYLANATDVTFLFDENCNTVPDGDENTACDELRMTWSSTPISLIWEDGHDIERDIAFTDFQLEPGKFGRSYEWKASDKAPLLVYDPNETGIVEDGSQLFGNWTSLGPKHVSLTPSAEAHSATQTGWRDGYQPLALLDHDGDGKISGSELEPFALWFDSNRDGVSDEGEVRTIESQGVTALYYRNTRKDQLTGNIIADVGYEREKDGNVVQGKSVDWLSDGASSQWELVQRKTFISALKCDGPMVSGLAGGIDDTGINPSSSPSQTSSFKEGALDGVWDWKIISNSNDGKSVGPEGVFILMSDKYGTLTGRSLVELPQKGSSRIHSIMRMASIEGRIDEQGNFNFTVNSGDGVIISNSGTLSSANNQMTGESRVRIRDGEKRSDYTYKWTATYRVLSQ